MKGKSHFGVAIRMVADILLLNMAAVFAAVARGWLLAEPYSPKSLVLLSRTCAFVTICGPAIFAMFGFYSRGRAYASKYKMLTMLQASSVLFLSFALFNYLMVKHGIVSRLGLLLTWGLATLLLVGARLWSRLWRTVLWREEAIAPVQAEREEGKVLLIGGGGYIGSSLLPRLLERGHKVRLLDAFIYGEDAVAPYFGHPNLEVVRADFRNIHDVVCCMRGVSQVIHLGAIVGDPACALDEDLTVEINLMATRTIAEVAKANGVRKFIFASTCSVYGANDELLDERSALNPVSLYARSKIACEHVLLSLRDASFSPVLLRFGTIYGLSGRTRFDLVVNLLAAKALAEGKITIFGKDQWRPFLHVHDAGRALLAMLEARPEQLTDVVFNVGSDKQNFTLGGVGEIIKRMVPSAELICSNGDSDRRNYRVDFSRIRKTLGFEPEWQLEDGVQQVMTAIRSGAVVDYRDPRYSNVKFLDEENGLQLLRSNGHWAEELLQVGKKRPLKVAYAATSSAD
jgi:nucleoside-diphosphate-sugar epimerase